MIVKFDASDAASYRTSLDKLVFPKDAPSVVAMGFRFSTVITRSGSTEVQEVDRAGVLQVSGLSGINFQW